MLIEVELTDARRMLRGEVDGATYKEKIDNFILY